MSVRRSLSLPLSLFLGLLFLERCSSQTVLALESLCREGGGRVELPPSPSLLHYSGPGLGTCHLHLEPPKDLALSLYTWSLDIQETPQCGTDFIQFGKTFLFFAQSKSPKFCSLHQPPDNKTYNVRLVSSPREWVEREAGHIHLWLSVKPTDRIKHVAILVTPFRRSCGPTERHWVKCAGAAACVRRAQYCEGPVACEGREERCRARDPSSSPPGPLMATGLPLSLLVISALVLVFSALFCGLFLRLCVQHLVRKREEAPLYNPPLDSAPSAPPAPPCSLPLPPPPSYSEAVGGCLQAPPPGAPPPYSLLLGPPGPGALGRSYTADS